MPPLRQESSKHTSSPEELLSLQNAVRQLLPVISQGEASAKISAAIFRACQCSFHTLHPPSRAKNEIWHLLRGAGANPSPSEVDDIHRLVIALQNCALQPLLNLSQSKDDFQLSRWNDSATAFFEQIVLTTGAGQRVIDPRQDSQLSTSAISSSTSQASSQTASSARVAHGNDASSSKPQFEPSWLRERCAQLEVVRAGALPAHEMAVSILTLLSDKSRTDDHLQSDLFDAFANDFDAVGDVLQKRSLIRQFHDAIAADCSEAYERFTNGATASNEPQRPRRNRGRTGRRRQTRMGSGAETSEFESDDVFLSQMLGGSAYEERQRAFPGVQMLSDSVIGSVDRVSLPKGSTRELGKGYEEVFVPPPLRIPVRQDQLIDVATGLAAHPELLMAMRGVKTLNRLQSAVFPIAFESDENLLVCAPTGAGKTNVALLTIFREIVALKRRVKKKFKVVYVAPMKALAAEVTDKFSQRLGPLGLTVKEFTGDMSLSRAESLASHVLVTTPEKWDVITRKSGSELGNAVTLFILDEVHLLHDDRGAVLESIVARTLRLSETAQRQIRLVGLSATLPNYADVGSFMRVNPKKGLFHFDGSHRPVPLSQTFIGITEGVNSSSNEARKRKEAKVHEVAWKKVKDSLLRGHQAMIFVHSRKRTASAAREMVSLASKDDIGSIFIGNKQSSTSSNGNAAHGILEEDDNGNSIMPSWAAKEIAKSRSSDIRELCAIGIGIHHAGLPRPDRKLVERLFAEGILRLLCCTSTLAWGVNLPARSVIIMGTEVYSPEKGAFVQLGILDVMQIFGRAGRPQFDTEGEGTIITDHEHLSKYISLLTSSVPIESQLGASASRLADHLNAEIVSGTVSSVGDGVRWLSYTYLSVRMPQNPLVYGINWEEVNADSGLHSRRATLIDEAAKALDDARMCKYDPGTGVLSPTDLGRVSSHFYVSHETIVLWNEMLINLPDGPAVTDFDWQRVYSSVIHAVATATEFEQIRSRQEEEEELQYLIDNACPIPLRKEAGSETKEGKVAILLQAYISRAQIRMSDLSYVVQSATRLLRALFEISLRRGLPSFALASLEMARSFESRIWPFQHPLWQFTYHARRERGLLVTPETVAAIEESGENDLATLRSKNREELSILIRAPKIVQTVEKVLKAIPTLEITNARVARLSNSLLLIDVSVVANFSWNDALHRTVQSWWLWVEDKEVGRIYHSQKILLTKREVQALNNDLKDGSQEQLRRTLDYSLTVAVFAPASPRYWVRVESDQWHTGGGACAELSVASLRDPREEKAITSLTSVTLGDVGSRLPKREADWFGNRLAQFNFVQMMTLDITRNQDDNVLVSSPPGCGQIAVAEFAMLRALQLRPDSAVVCLCADEGALRIREECWKQLSAFGRGKMVVLNERNNKVTIGAHIGAFSIVLSTPQTWNNYAQSLNEVSLYEKVSLFVLNDLHRMSDSSNVGLELIVTRLRRYQRKAGTGKTSGSKSPLPRVVGLSGFLPNAAQVADWLEVPRKKGFFCFGQDLRQVTCEPAIISVAGDRYASRMQSMNLPLYSRIQRHSPKDPVLIFVSSKRQTLLTAQDLLRLASLDGKQGMFLGSGDVDSRHLRVINDAGLRESVPKGIGLYHESLTTAERSATETLFESGRLRVLIAPFYMASRIKVRAQNVIVKGTEVFNPKKRRYEDVAVSAVMSMIGHAGRPGIDNKCFSNVFVHEPKLTLIRLLLNEPLPLESALMKRKPEEILLREVVSKHVVDIDDSIDWLWSTFFYQRLCTNPGYYGLKKKGGSSKEGKSNDSRRSEKIFEAERRSEFCRNFVLELVERLEELGCIEKRSKTAGNTIVKTAEGQTLKSTRLGELCCEFRISGETGRLLGEKLGECHSLEDVMNLMSICEEVGELGMEYEEDAAWTRLFERITDRFVEQNLYRNASLAAKGLKISGWMESTQKRGKMLWYNLCIDCNERSSDMRVSKMVQVFETAKRLIGAGLNLAVHRGMSLDAVKQLAKVAQCIWSGSVPTSDIWLLCGIDGKPICPKGRAAGWTTVDDVWKDEQAFAMFVANECTEVERSAIMRAVNAVPRLDIGETVLKRDENTACVTVSVQRKSTSVGDNRFGWRKECRFIVAVFKEEDGTILGLKRVTVDLSKKSTRLDSGCVHVVVDIEDASAERLGVWLGSEEWIGIEAQRTIP